MTLGVPVQLDASALIDLAEDATLMSPGHWSVALLQRAYPDANIDAVLALPLGTRDRLALAIRAGLSGAPLCSEPVCKACGETYEMTLDLAAFGLDEKAPWPNPDIQKVMVGDTNVALRPVALGDLLVVENIADPDTGAEVLAARVLDGDDRGPNDLPMEALSDALEMLDPGADIWLGTDCPDCGETQSTAFDPIYFVAHEVQQMSRQVLQDVVDIARIFHWSEADILALPEHRRAYYVAEALA